MIDFAVSKHEGEYNNNVEDKNTENNDIKTNPYKKI